MGKHIDLTGNRYGKLIVTGRGDDYVSPSGGHLLRWKCVCECGRSINATTSQLKRGMQSCGCVPKREDLSGRRFGKLTVLRYAREYVSPKGSHMAEWLCLCECGRETIALGMSLKNGDKKTCSFCGNAKLIDCVGKKYGSLYVISKIEHESPTKYICKCDCGNIIEAYKRDLLSGKKNNCGCNKKTKEAHHITNKHNYIGEKIGELTILEELPTHITPNGSRQRYFKVRCNCGEIFDIGLSSAIKSKMCKKCLLKKRRVDITGKRYGKLVVLSMAEDYISPSGHRLSRCNCLCDCGNNIVVNMSGLVTGSTRSCGCIKKTAGLLKDNAELSAKYDYDKNAEIGLNFDKLTARSSTKAWWKCKDCGNSWYATIASQNDKIKHGCPYCSGRLVIEGKTDLQSVCPDLIKEWDYKKNTILPSQVSAHSNQKAWWICSEGHSWQALISNRVNGSGCPRCNIENVNSFCEQAVYYYVKKCFPDSINGDNHLGVELDIYIPSKNIAIEYDGDVWHKADRRKRNDEYKNKICKDNEITLIRIREPKLSAIDDCVVFVRKDSTSEESLDKVISEVLEYIGIKNIEVDTKSDSGKILSQYATKKKKNSLASCYPDIAREWHPTKNGELTPDKVSKSARRIVWWLGKCGHEWTMSVSDRTVTFVRSNGKTKKQYGCPYCAGKRILKGFNDLQSQYPLIAEEWHPTKNGELKPDEITSGSGKLVWWLGKCGHEWQSTPDKRCHVNGQCPVCFAINRSPSVICVETGEVFQSVVEATKCKDGVLAGSIHKCCKGMQKTAGGYHWRYYTESDESKYM